MANMEDDLCNQVAALKEDLLREQNERGKMENKLTQELVEARKQIGQ